MKRTTSIKISEKIQIALTATGFLSLVMALTCMSWFA